MEKRNSRTAGINWESALSSLRGSLSSEEEAILRMLVAGRTQPDIGKQLGLHRSAVWRRVKRLRQRVGEPRSK
jgi:DNA-binding NarL/FixJ family response regulator